MTFASRAEDLKPVDQDESHRRLADEFDDIAAIVDLLRDSGAMTDDAGLPGYMGGAHAAPTLRATAASPYTCRGE